jgi:hypothetical protein
MKKKSVIIIFSIFFLVAIAVGIGIYLKITREKNAIIAESNSIAEEVKTLTYSNTFDEATIIKINEQLKKFDDPKFENTEAKSQAYSFSYTYGQQIYQLFKQEWEKKLMDYKKLELYYTLLKNLRGSESTFSNIKVRIDRIASEKYNKIYKELYNDKPNMEIVNSNYNFLVKNLNYSEFREKAEHDIANKENIRQAYLEAESRMRQEYYLSHSPLDSINIGDPVSYVYRLKGYYKESTSEGYGVVVKHFYGSSGTNYKYITATNGYVDYISY